MLQRILIGFALCTQITTLVASDMDHLTPRTAGKQLFHAAQERDQESVRHLLRANPGGVDFEEAGRYLADNHPSLIGEWLALKPSPEGIGGAFFMAARTSNSRLVQQLLNAGPSGYMASLAGYDIVKRHPQFISQWLQTRPYSQGIGCALTCAAEMGNIELTTRFLGLGPTRECVGNAFYASIFGTDKDLMRRLLSEHPSGLVFSKAGVALVEAHPDLIESWLAEKPSKQGIAAALKCAQQQSKMDLVEILMRV